jgi:hypothetical protein
MNKTLITLVLLAIGMLSCGKHDKKVSCSEDYLIFGHFYGMCIGERCVEIFKLDQSKLSEDTNDKYPSFSSFYRGSYIPLSDKKLSEVRDLVDYFPSKLLSEPNKVFGTPDASDGGGLYIEYYHNGSRNYWIIDNMKSNTPSYLHNFVDKVQEKIAILQ